MKNLTKSNGFPSFRAMMEDFWNPEGFFNQIANKNELLPAVNIKNKKNEYQIEVAVPGFKKEDFEVTVENGILNISAATSTDNEELTDEYTRREFSMSSFSRSFGLPDDTSDDQVKANYKDGLLKLTIKKSQEKKLPAKKVKID